MDSRVETDLENVVSGTDSVFGRWLRPAPLCYLIGSLLFLYTFLQNAWVTDDAYITFRAVEQVFDGNGPVWNPHERVQVYTHPLWFLCLCMVRVVVRDLFFGAILLSGVCCAAMLVLCARLLRSPGKWLTLVICLVGSKSFMDYTTSGLENPLSTLLVCLFAAAAVRAVSAGREAPTSAYVHAYCACGLLATCRHDLTLLCVPVMGVLFLRHVKRVRFWRAATWCVVGMTPLVLWTAFAVFYYGFPFPNSAYAKLGTGLPLLASHYDMGLLSRGVLYVRASVLFDPLIVVYVGLLVLAMVGVKRLRVLYHCVGAALVLHTLYLLKAGGDYMAGRFFSVPIFLCLLLIAEWADSSRKRALVLAVPVLAAMVMVTAPIRSTPGYTNPWPSIHWVSDERALYFPAMSLYRHVVSPPEACYPRTSVTAKWYRQALAFRRIVGGVYVHGNVGILGYEAGTHKIILDLRGVTDPLLARLPALPNRAAGHYDREMPKGYDDSVLNGTNQIEDVAIARLYDDVKLVTQGPLLSGSRFKAIVRLNF